MLFLKGKDEETYYKKSANSVLWIDTFLLTFHCDGVDKACEHHYSLLKIFNWEKKERKDTKKVSYPSVAAKHKVKPLYNNDIFTLEATYFSH